MVIAHKLLVVAIEMQSLEEMHSGDDDQIYMIVYIIIIIISFLLNQNWYTAANVILENDINVYNVKHEEIALKTRNRKN